MDSQLSKFISSRQEKGEGWYTHVSQIAPTGKYNISRRDDDDFWNLYCDRLYNNTEMVSGLAERPNDFLPVLNDSDIKILYNPQIHNIERPLYTTAHIKATVIIYQKHLRQVIQNYEPRHGVCVVLEKRFPSFDDSKQYIKHGFHLHFINAVMHKVDQDIHLIPRVRREVAERNLFRDIGVEASEDVIDASCTNKFWLLYGSKKKSHLQSYRVSMILDDNCGEITLEDAMSDYKLLDVHGDPVDMSTHPLDYYLPRILSIHPGSRSTVTAKGDLNIITKKLLKKASESKMVYEDLPVPEALKKARELMKLLHASRADNYEDWLNIGWLLYNIGDGTEEAFDMWVEFSARTTKKNNFSESACMYQWQSMTRGTKTIGSLYFYAKQDNPSEFKNIVREDNDKHLNESLGGGHHDMAKWLFNKYRNEFVCACPEKSVWYRYKNGRWFINKSAIDLRTKISVELVNEYKDLKKKVCDKMSASDDDSELQKKLKIIHKIIASLKQNAFKNSIIKECHELFYDDEFSEKLDMNPYLLHFTNGTLDLKEGRFRSHNPEDYLSLTTKYDFVQYTAEDMAVIEVDDHFSKVFPDPELKQYFMEYMASLLEGYNTGKTFLNMSGEGDNAKSINMDLLKQTLGQYMKILPTSLIVGKRTQSSQATPELSGIQGVRFAIVQEPNNKDVINIGALKEYSGNDAIYTRGLFKEGQEIRPMLKLAIICNQLPKLPCDDPAVWNRIRVLPHESCFPKDNSTVPETLEDQMRVKRFPRDPLFSERLPKMKSALMWMIFEHYKRIRREGKMIEPEKVQSATATYRKNNDVFVQYIAEKMMIEPENPKAIIGVVETYNSFKTWFNDSYPNLHSQIPSKEDMRYELSKKWGELNRSSKWCGYRLRTSDDDEREGVSIVIREEDMAIDEEGL